MEGTMEFPRSAEGIRAYVLYEHRNKENRYAVGCIRRDRFIEVSESYVNIVMNTIRLMDGTRDFEEIQEEVERICKYRIDVRELYDKLKRANLLYIESHEKDSRNEFEMLGIKLIDFSLNQCKCIFSLLAKMTHIFLILFCVLFLATIACVIRQYEYIPRTTLLGFGNSYILDVISLLSIMIFSVFIHEFAHAVTGARYGLTPQRLTVSIYLYVSPIIYIKIPGIYTLRPRQRIHVFAAGVLANASLCCIGMLASIMLLQHNRNGILIQGANYLWYVNLTFCTVNLCPLLPLDGYFILTTILKTTNLRKQLLNPSISTGKKGIGRYIYFFLSVVLMGTIFIREIFTMCSVFFHQIGNGVLVALWSIKQYLVMIALMIIANRIKTHKNKEMRVNVT